MTTYWGEDSRYLPPQWEPEQVEYTGYHYVALPCGYDVTYCFSTTRSLDEQLGGYSGPRLEKAK